MGFNDGIASILAEEPRVPFAFAGIRQFMRPNQPIDEANAGGKPVGGIVGIGLIQQAFSKIEFVLIGLP